MGHSETPTTEVIVERAFPVPCEEALPCPKVCRRKYIAGFSQFYSDQNLNATEK
jgi:hypothetical protein